MKVLACSDGHRAAERAIRWAVRFLKSGDEVVLLGIVEDLADRAELETALSRAKSVVESAGAQVAVEIRHGLPIAQIRTEAAGGAYDFVVIGAERRADEPLALRAKAYDLIHQVEAPVLAVIGECPEEGGMLVCSSAAHPADQALKLVARMARRAQMPTALFHVLVAPPPLYAGLADRERDVSTLLHSGAALGRKLRAEQKVMEGEGIQAALEVRHGLVGEEIVREALKGRYALIVVGATPAEGGLRSYVMGNITSQIVREACCAVLIIRHESLPASRARLVERLRRWWWGK